VGNVLDNYQTYPDCFQRVIPFLLASVIYHEPFLRSNLSDNHPLWNQRVFTNSLSNVLKIICCRLTSAESNMKASGLQNSIIEQIKTLSSLMDEFEKKTSELPTQLREVVNEAAVSIPLATVNPTKDRSEWCQCIEY